MSCRISYIHIYDNNNVQIIVRCNNCNSLNTHEINCVSSSKSFESKKTIISSLIDKQICDVCFSEYKIF
jgi:hypothetical protein